MKYLFFCPTLAFGGLEMQMVRRAADAIEKGDEAVLVLLPGSEMVNYALRLGVPFRTISQRIDYVDVLTAWKLGKIIKHEKPDSCIVGITRNLSIAILAKKIFNQKTPIVLFQQMISGLPKIDFFHNWVYRNVDTSIVPIKLMANLLTTSTIFPKEKIQIIPYGIHLDEVTSKSYEPTKEKRRFGIPTDKIIIGQTARFEHLKDQETTIRGFAEAAIPNAVLVLAGGGDEGYRERMRLLVSELGLNESVLFLPFTLDFGKLLSCFDIYVMSSLCETFSLALIQAMAAGKPVIGTNSGGTPEAIKDGRNGLLFDPRDTATLAMHLKTLVNDPSFSARLAHQAEFDARQRYDHRSVNEKFFKACLTKSTDKIQVQSPVASFS
jgi:glycosyltransferase involved in cell wall biosynthesis